MKLRYLIATAPVVAALAVLLSPGPSRATAAHPAQDPPAPAPAAEPATPPTTAMQDRGRYLVTVLDCNGCHTPFKDGPAGPEPDMTRMLSGHPQDAQLPPPPVLPAGPWIAAFSATGTAWSGPWGVSFTANLTPDRETGLGDWSYANFRDTLRNGRHLGRGRELLPPMPWPAYGQLSDDDMQAVFAFLQSIPAISNRVPEPLPPPAAAP